MIQELLDLMRGSKRFNPYEPLTKEQIERRHVLKLQAEREVIDFAEMAKEMLQDGRYIKLRQKLEEVIRHNVQLMIDYVDPDPNRYYAKMQHFQEQIRVLTLIVDLPTDYIRGAEEVEKRKKQETLVGTYERG